jgi:hypothetical protein
MTWNWWVLALLVPCWVAQNTIHELSHLVSAWLFEKLRPRGLWPLWHWVNGDDPDQWRLWRPWELWKRPWPNAYFFFARFVSDPPKTPRPARHTTFIAPVYAATAIVTACTLLAVLGPLPARVFFLVPGVCALVDAANWWRGYFWGKPTCDGQRWRHGDAQN